MILKFPNSSKTFFAKNFLKNIRVQTWLKLLLVSQYYKTSIEQVFSVPQKCITALGL